MGIDTERIKRAVYNRIDFELPEEVWKEIDEAFGVCWNEVIGFGNEVDRTEVINYVADWLRKRKVVILESRLTRILDIMFEHIKMTGGFLDESQPFLPMRSVRSSEEVQDAQMDNVTEIIKDYFDTEGLNYSLEPEEDFVQAFYINFEGRNENLRFCIRVLKNKSVCLIICIPKTKISLEYRDKAIQTMNEFNGNSLVVSGSIGEEGNVVFSLGRNTDGNTFSKEAFIADFHSVFRVADMETAQILKKAYVQASEE